MIEYGKNYLVRIKRTVIIFFDHGGNNSCLMVLLSVECLYFLVFLLIIFVNMYFEENNWNSLNGYKFFYSDKDFFLKKIECSNFILVNISFHST